MLPSSFPSAFKHYKPRSQRIYGVIAVSKDNKILLVKGRERNKWSFPKGHIKPYENTRDCALRECFEETGISFNKNYDDHRKLSSGSYYIYRNLDEEEPIIQDYNEICDASWFSIPSMMNLYTNVDVSKFLQHYKNIL
uniref:Nudix hydrolase domain-containing protein n=1 Tax=viral metagenome TaxID=1070528 RepID=A0A6C0D805_9ZZZZ